MEEEEEKSWKLLASEPSANINERESEPVYTAYKHTTQHTHIQAHVHLFGYGDRLSFFMLELYK